jgi:mannosyl-oligosaccharide glucosidase
MAGKRPVHTRSIPIKVTNYETEFIMKEISENAGNALQDVKGSNSAPDPSFTLQLSDETLSGNNLLAFQKFFDGKFQFDVFYESRSAQKKLSGMCLIG